MNYRILAFLILVFLVLVVFVNAATNGTVSVNVYNSTVWWNDTVIVNGTATYTNGSAVGSGQTANVTLDSFQYCTGTTTAAGFYTCNFRAPLKLGVYTLQVTVTNSTGQTITNTTTFTVKPNFGQTVIGKTARSVFEVPMVIQDMNGEIRQIWTRVIVWKA
jgi:hypothetical protein